MLILCMAAHKYQYLPYLPIKKYFNQIGGHFLVELQGISVQYTSQPIGSRSWLMEKMATDRIKMLFIGQYTRYSYL